MARKTQSVRLIGNEPRAEQMTKMLKATCTDLCNPEPVTLKQNNLKKVMQRNDNGCCASPYS